MSLTGLKQPQQRGFTLIEVMITIALLGFLVLVSVPLTGGWVQKADILEAEGDLLEAFGHAKAAALRNNVGATQNAAVSAVCLSNTNQLQVVASETGANASCGSPNTGAVLWSTQVDTDVRINTAGSTSNAFCMCFNNQALPTTSGCSTCTITPTFTLVAGANDETLSFY